MLLVSLMLKCLHERAHAFVGAVGPGRNLGMTCQVDAIQICVRPLTLLG